MNEKNNRPEPLDLAEYAENRWRFPPEELMKYAGQHVAFSADGKRIVASAETDEELYKKLLAAGIDPSQVVGSYVDPL
jgi:hypothetical protein